MDYLEINEVGNYETWPESKLMELGTFEAPEKLGQSLLFENDTMVMWSIKLEPGQRLPFRKISRDYLWISMTEGLALTRYNTGKIAMFRFNKHETKYFEFENDSCIYDLENIGEDNLHINAIEFK